MPLDPHKLRSRRQSLDWSQAAMARRLGIQPPHYCRLEAGRIANPRLATMERLAAVLACRLDDIATGKVPRNWSLDELSYRDLATLAQRLRLAACPVGEPCRADLLEALRNAERTLGDLTEDMVRALLQDSPQRQQSPPAQTATASLEPGH